MREYATTRRRFHQIPIAGLRADPVAGSVLIQRREDTAHGDRCTHRATTTPSAAFGLSGVVPCSDHTYAVTSSTSFGASILPQGGMPLASTPFVMVALISSIFPPWIHASSVRFGPMMPPPSAP